MCPAMNICASLNRGSSICNKCFQFAWQILHLNSIRLLNRSIRRSRIHMWLPSCSSCSSKRGMLTVEIDATRDFETTRLQSIKPSKSMVRRRIGKAMKLYLLGCACTKPMGKSYLWQVIQGMIKFIPTILDR